MKIFLIDEYDVECISPLKSFNWVIYFCSLSQNISQYYESNSFNDGRQNLITQLNDFKGEIHSTSYSSIKNIFIIKTQGRWPVEFFS
jgi:hypothetical protein